ncbi:MAG TPA: methyltransferase domain-containing protein [Burkholderiales bacterium]|nr:methyltransferase domain-containing protein [Burkholderiales bacterium]
MSLRHSYRLLAPFYDWVAGPLFERARRASIDRLPADRPLRVLIDGAGTGLDLRHLPALHAYIGLDITRAMLQRAVHRGRSLDIEWVEGDSECLPFHDAAFDYVLLHLILAVVPDGAQALREAARVVKPGGRLLILDKFLPRGQRAPLRRLLSPIAARIATRTDVVLEDLLDAVDGMEITEDRPALAGGWFRYVTLQRRA